MIHPRSNRYAAMIASRFDLRWGQLLSAVRRPMIGDDRPQVLFAGPRMSYEGRITDGLFVRLDMNSRINGTLKTWDGAKR
jgi:hypothetical protein